MNNPNRKQTEQAPAFLASVPRRDEGSSSRRFKVLTYNIRHGRGLDDVIDLERIGGVLSRSGADIACLQEVDRGLPRSNFAHQAERLAERLHFSFAFHANFGLLAAGMGNAILSRFEIYSTWNNPLPFSGEPRGLLHAQAILPFGPIEVYSTHWGLTSAQRHRQAEACTKAILDNDDPVVLCGDLNATPSAPEIVSLIEVTKLVDAGPHEGNTFTSGLPVAKIDYILVSEHFTVVKTEVLESDASDHLPLLATLEFRG